MKNNVVIFSLMLFCVIKSEAQITVFPYIEDFETAPSWTAVTAPTSSLANTSDWAWGTPNHTYVIQSAGSGVKCWCAGGLTGAFYNNWEQSYVKSPVFDFTNLLYPHIKFKLFYDSEYHFDGGNLQYSLNGGVTWTDVGTVGGTGTAPIIEPNDCNTQNWYNYPNINYLNSPAGFVTSKHGWCGNTQAGGVGWDPASPATSCVGGHGPGQWITAEHCLTGCAGQANVTLRFTFASGFTCNNFDGFAFDRVEISNGVPNVANYTSTCGAGNTINFTSTFAPCPQTNAWLWNFGDPASGATNTLTTQNASHAYSAPGTYTVVLIAKGGACNPPDTITNVVQVMSSSITTHTNVSCFGGNDGAAVATSSLGALPIVYSWSPSGGSATTASGLTAGNYTFTVTDANGCQKTSTIAITQPSVIIASVASTSITCSGLSNGTATLTASGGTAPLSYTWLPTGGNLTTSSGLSVGNYTVMVSDFNLCTKSVTFAITQPTVITASALVTNASCATLGSGTITASGGTGALSYSWSPTGGTNNVASGLNGGNYSVTVTDLNSCSKTVTLSIAPSGSYTTTVSSTSVSCFSGTNGTASAMVTGTSTPFSYTWSPTGGNASTASSLTAGNYTVTVSDGNGCIQTKTTAIAQPSVISISGASNNITCNGLSNGSATVTASGGVAPLSYSWSPTVNSSSVASGLGIGNYTATVSDVNACVKTITVGIVQPTAITTTVLATNGLCGNLGSATITASGGTGALSYVWLPSGGTSNIASGLSGGNYSVTVTDMNSCSKTETLTIIQSNGFTIAVTSTSVSCFGDNNGSATAVITGTNTPYTYTWSPSGGNGLFATNLTSGSYTIAVTDGSGCVKNKTTSIIQPSALAISLSNTTICNGKQATLTPAVSGGTAPYAYQWQPSGSVTSSITVTPTITTSYTLTVTDQNSCTVAPVIVRVNVLPPLGVTVNGPFTVCSGSTVSLSATASGGNGNYQYMWMPGNIAGAQISPTVNSTTQYTVVVSDGCTVLPAKAITQVNVIISPTVNIRYTKLNGCPRLCSTFYDSTLIASGMVNSWNWSFSDGQISNSSSPTICFNTSGTYSGTLTVVTNNGCQSAPGVLSNITVYPVPIADFTSTSFDGNMFDSPFVLTNTSVNANSIKWETTQGNYTSNTISLNYDNEGLYSVKLIAINSYGCIDSITKGITVKPLFTFYAPNAFTPNNNDNINDVFFPLGEGWDESTYNLFIFDRWGEQIYSTNDVRKGWNGKAKNGNDMAQQDVYIWKVDLDDIFKKQHHYIGHVTLLK